MKDATKTCENCRYWDNSVRSNLDDADETGRCVRQPPRPDFRTAHAVWPFTAATDWCGEFQAENDAPSGSKETT